MQHLFETEHQENLEFAVSGRVGHQEVLEENRTLREDPTASALLNAFTQPVLVFNANQQIVYMNDSAQGLPDGGDQLLGLRFGEFLGTDHLMQGHRCGDPDGCANCNALPAIFSALSGQQSLEQGTLVMHPDSDQRKTYQLEGKPLPFQGKTFGMLILHPAG
ncbi:MAG: hypothetical protein ACFCU3_08375 [Verrucomicrobiales bacterium]